jgi:eukaryotic-like serine/threonine-protein kinase
VVCPWQATGGYFVSLPAGTHIGKYVIQRKLAEGGMAEIFLASSFGPEGFEKQVVIKRVRPVFAADASFIAMFVTEARLANRLNHANIVQIFDFARHEDTFYIAMEYVRGRSLAQAHESACELGVPVLPALTAQIVADVARGLSFAHRLTEQGQPLGLVHRDVTPQNILIAYEGAVKLADFGIAKAGPGVSNAGVLKGKFAYMSPEQSRGESVDSRTDVFALGVILWELLSGRRLFTGDNEMAVLRAVQEQHILPAEKFNAAVDGTLSAIVMRCLERARDARFQSAQELERALNRYLNTLVEHPEDADVRTWMYAVFPTEAGRIEDTCSTAAHWAGRLEGQTEPLAVPGADSMTGDPSRSGRSGFDVLSNDSLQGQSLKGFDPDSFGAKRPASKDAAVTGAGIGLGAPTSRRTPSVKHKAKPRLLVLAGAVGWALVVIALVVWFGAGHDRSVESKRMAKSAGPAVPVLASEPMKPMAELLLDRASAGEPTLQQQVPRPEGKTRLLSGSVSQRKKGAAPATLSPTTVNGQAVLPNDAATEPLGMLILTVDPWGEVFIDNKSRGEQVGRTEYQLTPGSHQLEVKGPSSWGPEQILIESTRTASQSVTLN